MSVAISTVPLLILRPTVTASNVHEPSRLYHCQDVSSRVSVHATDFAAACLPDVSRTTTSNAAASPSPTPTAPNNGLTPTRACLASTASLTVRSIDRPPGSFNRTITSASSGFAVFGIAGNPTDRTALPSAPVDGSASIGWRTGSIFSSARPNLKPGHPSRPLAALTTMSPSIARPLAGGP